jgi:serine/threonine protein kinase
VAVKIIDKDRLDERLMRKVRHEINSLRALSSHENIVELKDVIESDKRICLIMEYCAEGELFDLIT